MTVCCSRQHRGEPFPSTTRRFLHVEIASDAFLQPTVWFVRQRECQDLAEFVTKVLGPYSLNVTTAARLCSASLCQGKGRCVRQNPDSSAYLHLPPLSAAAEKATGKVSGWKKKNKSLLRGRVEINSLDKQTQTISCLCMLTEALISCCNQCGIMHGLKTQDSSSHGNLKKFSVDK